MTKQPEKRAVNSTVAAITTGLLALAASLITGCSGSSTDNTPAATPPSYANIELSGTAAKGIIQQGSISAHELNSRGELIATVGEATTDADGSYTLTLENYRGGPLLLTLTSGPETTMKCDVVSGCGPRRDDQIADSNSRIDFGEWYLPGNFTLTALLPRASANEMIPANLTPFTHMAARRVHSLGQIDATTVANTNSAVSNLLGGIDILAIAPLDITDAAAELATAPPSRVTYAALCAAIANLAGQNPDQSPDIDTALATLARSFDSGTFPADDSGSAQDGNLFSMRELLDASASVFSAAGITDITGVSSALAASITSATDADGDGIAEIAPAPSASAADTNLAKVKALMADIRTWGSVINAQTAQPGDAFREQIELAFEAAEVINELYISELLYLSAKAIINYHATDSELYKYRGFGVTSPRWPNGFSRGTITRPSDGLYLIEGAAVEPVISGNDYLTLDLTVQLPIDDAVSDRFTYGIVSATISGPYADATISKGLITLNLSEEYTSNVQEDAATIEARLIEITETIEIDFDLSLTQKWDLHNSALMAIGSGSQEPVQLFYDDPVTFTGAVAATFYPVVENTPAEVTWLAPSTVTISGQVSNSSGDSLAATLAANIGNAELFIPISDTQLEGPDNWLQLNATPDAGNPNLGLAFSMQLEALPEATFRLTANRTGFEAGDVELTIAFDNRQLKIGASGDAAADTISSEVVITNQDGVRLTLNTEAGQRRGTFSYNGNPYGSLEETDSGYLKISYIDGTFEIF